MALLVSLLTKQHAAGHLLLFTIAFDCLNYPPSCLGSILDENIITEFIPHFSGYGFSFDATVPKLFTPRLQKLSIKVVELDFKVGMEEYGLCCVGRFI